MNRISFLRVVLVILSVDCFACCCQNYNWNPLVSKTSHLAVIILARGDSKGIKLKNIAKVDGKPLLKISLQEIKKVNFVDSIWVSTDHISILQEAEKEQVNVHWRSTDSATDAATSLYGVQEFLNHHTEVDILGLVQCTSPFIKSKYLQKVVNYMRLQWECAFSVTRSYKLIWREIEDRIVPFNFDPLRRPRRQDWKGDLVENGMFYFARRQLIQNGLLQSNK